MEDETNECMGGIDQQTSLEDQTDQCIDGVIQQTTRQVKGPTGNLLMGDIRWVDGCMGVGEGDLWVDRLDLQMGRWTGGRIDTSIKGR